METTPLNDWNYTCLSQLFSDGGRHLLSPAEFKKNLSDIIVAGGFPISFERAVMDEAPPHSTLVDVGAGLGLTFSLPLAKAKPKVNVILLDSLTEDDLRWQIDGSGGGLAEHYLRGMLLVRAGRQPATDLSAILTTYLRLRAETSNLTFFNKALRRDGVGLVTLPFEPVPRHPLIISAFNAPHDLGNLTVDAALHHEADIVAVATSNYAGQPRREYTNDEEWMTWMAQKGRTVLRQATPLLERGYNVGIQRRAPWASDFNSADFYLFARR